jgi:hypothetical protein
VFGRCEPATGIEPFGRLVTQVMTTMVAPRDCNGSFEPRIVRNGQTRLMGVQRADHRAVCAGHYDPGHPHAPARDVMTGHAGASAGRVLLARIMRLLVTAMDTGPVVAA